ncbi:MAG: DMT family transporter, partial [Lachnospiraceae bacterium]|nr:DMT family transporter [Lachnospiraceae bacterium]
MNKQRLSTLGLIFITFLSAIQYVFLTHVPDTMPTFAFIGVTNLIGLVLMGAVFFKKLATLKKRTLFKGMVLAALLTAMNFFMVLGSKNTETVIVSSLLSLYFIFVTPILLLLKKKVNFFSGIATMVAILALLLMFGANTSDLFSSKNVIFLIICDIFFAGYVVSISVLGEEEDSTQLTLAQMLFAFLFSTSGWLIESFVQHREVSLPSDPGFWVGAVFIGIFIRAVYGMIQMYSQKHVSALTASLIFSSEIIITL